MSNIYILDTETTGLKNPEATEIAYIQVSSNINELSDRFIAKQTAKYEIFSERFKPSKPIESEASRVTGIFMKDLKGKPPASSFKLPPSCKFLVGHNIMYDYNVLNKPAGISLICTLEIARIILDKTKHIGLANHKLGTLIKYFYPKEYTTILEGQHGALADCKAVYYLLLKLSELAPHYMSSWEKLATLCKQPGDVKEYKRSPITVQPFGKYKGSPFSTIPTDYLRWQNSIDNLSPSLKKAIQTELRKRKVIK